MKRMLSLRSVAALLSLATAALGLALVLMDPLALQALRNNGFDQYQRWQPRTYEAVPVRIVDIDEASLEKIGQWPWSRRKLAELVDQLGHQGAAAIGFDVVFAEPDRTSPRRASRTAKHRGSQRSTSQRGQGLRTFSTSRAAWAMRSCRTRCRSACLLLCRTPSSSNRRSHESAKERWPAAQQHLAAFQGMAVRPQR